MKLVLGLTYERLIEKNYLQACVTRIIVSKVGSLTLTGEVHTYFHTLFIPIGLFNKDTKITKNGKIFQKEGNKYMLQVRLNLQVNLFQPVGQLVSTQVSLGQVQSTGHRSLFYQYRKYPKHSVKLTLGLNKSF